jgi:hypothetical protein
MYVLQKNCFFLPLLALPYRIWGRFIVRGFLLCLMKQVGFALRNKANTYCSLFFALPNENKLALPYEITGFAL